MAEGKLPKGELGPEPMRFYTEPVIASLMYHKITKDPFPTPQEAQVWFNLIDQLQTAFVPLYLVDEEKGTVTATLVGEFQGEILVSFPPTNFGQTKFSVRADVLERIVA